jgi:hypothetical protein
MSIFQLVAFGAQDRYLTGNPSSAFFHVIYKPQKTDIIDIMAKLNYTGIYYSEQMNADIITNLKSVLIDIYDYRQKEANKRTDAAKQP